MGELQIENRIFKENDNSDDNDTDNNDEKNIPLIDLLEIGCNDTKMAPMVYSTIIHYLMEHQTTKPFLIVMDEYNCYYNEYPGQYFHHEYDPDVKESIPYEQISLFRPILQAMELKSSNKKVHKKKH